MTNPRILYDRSKRNCGTTPRFDRAGLRIEFNLTFAEWLQVWETSGKLHLRGSRKGCYVMSRRDDLGHYEMGNVFIQRHEDNVREAQIRHIPKKSMHKLLSPAQVEQIRSELLTDTGVEVSRRWNISPSTVCNINRGRVYA